MVRKQIFRLLIGTALTATAALAPVGALAQMPAMPAIPVDSAVRIGRLDNGLTYYIRHHEYPKGLADFYIAQKVGSIQEEDSQRGLAHFLEHMCFNGTVSFPGNELISWLESVGVKFGRNLNAYTSVDRTVYNMCKVPVAREGVQDSCLLILRDWADGLLLAPEEIDKERGVIHEEWRQSNVGQMRILTRLLPKIYPDSKYGHRLPIGTMEVVDNFAHQELRDYYEKWYRPDLQGIMVVGDVDPDRIEAKIKELFSPIAMPANPAERQYEPVADTPGTIYAVGSDKEMPYSVMQLMFKHEATPDAAKGTLDYMVQDYVLDMVVKMFNTRIVDIVTKPDAPMTNGGAAYGDFLMAKTKDAFLLSAVPKDSDNPLQALATVYREGLRAVRGGFTATEYDRARSEYLSELEKTYTNRATRTSTGLVRDYVEHFLDNEPIPGIENEFAIMSQLANSIPVAMVNQAASQLMPADNRVLLALFPEKEGVTVPTEEDFAKMLAQVDAETIEAYVDEALTEPLVAQLPAPGQVVATDAGGGAYGATVWTLANGAKVVAKPTDFKAGEIRFAARAFGGTSTMADTLDNELRYLSVALKQLGMGPYDNATLAKHLAGKQASLTMDISATLRDIEGATVPKDLPTLMEMVHALFTSASLSADEFEAGKNSLRSLLQNQQADPRYQFSTRLRKHLYEASRNHGVDVAVVDAARRELLLSIIRQALANAADYTFYFVGSFTLDELKPLVEQYIGSLPGHAVEATLPPLRPELAMRAGAATESEQMAMDTPVTYAAVLVSGDMPYTHKNQKCATMAAQILSARLIKLVREEMGAVYSISASGSLSRYALRPAMLQSIFPMKPEMRDAVLDVIDAQMRDMTDPANITAEELGKVREYMVKDAREALRKNESLIANMQGYQLVPVDTYQDAADMANAITAVDIAAYMKALLDQANRRVFLLEPEAAPAAPSAAE